MWFDSSHIFKFQTIPLDDIKGYVLPHAGTSYTGNILSHTLRFKPRNFFKTVLILYLPSNETHNVSEGSKSYFHEYYVPMKTLDKTIKRYWKYGSKNFVGVNVLNNETIPNNIDLKTTLIVLSSDFSHFLPLSEAIEVENCGARAMMFGNFNEKLDCIQHVDDHRTYKFMYNLFQKNNMNYSLEWIGRTRSPGEKAVGYLSFLIRNNNIPKNPDALTVSVFNSSMDVLGSETLLFTNNKWNKELEKIKVSKIIANINKKRNVEYYKITYLYKVPNKSTVLGKKTLQVKQIKGTKGTKKMLNYHVSKFIRGWHAIMYGNKLILPEMILTNYYDNGQPISISDQKYPQEYKFNLDRFLKSVKQKKGNGVILYTPFSKYFKLTNKT